MKSHLKKFFLACFRKDTKQSVAVDQCSVEKSAHWLVNAGKTKVIPKIFCSYFFDTFCISLEVLILVFQHSILNHQNRFKRLPGFLIFFFRSLNSIVKWEHYLCKKHRWIFCHKNRFFSPASKKIVKKFPHIFHF